MAIKFGSTAVNAIKYCNASGELQDVASVVRNGTGIWTPTPVGPRTDNNGYWYYEPRWAATDFKWNVSRNCFVNLAWSDHTISFSNGQWILTQGTREYTYPGTNRDTQISFATGFTFTWTDVANQRTDNQGTWASLDGTEFVYDAMYQKFLTDSGISGSKVYYNDGVWCLDIPSLETCTSSGNEYSRNLQFVIFTSLYALTWSAPE